MYRTLLIFLLIVGFGLPDARAQIQADAQAEVRASRLLVRGMTMLHSGDVASARASFEMALHLSPDNATILAALAEAHAASGSMQDALHYGARALTVDASDPENARLLSDRYAAEMNINAGIDALERHVRAAPGLSSSLLLITYLARHGRSADAIREVRSAFESSGFHDGLLDVTLGISADDDSGPDKVSLLADLIRDSGDQSLVMEVLADPRVGEDVSLRLISMLEGDFPHLAGLVSAAEHRTGARPGEAAAQPAPSGNDLDALEWYDRAMASPRDADLWAVAAKHLLESGRAGLAFEAARDAATFFPGRDDLSSLRIRAALALGDRGAVREAARGALRFETSIDLAYAGILWSGDGDSHLDDEALEFILSVEAESAVSRLASALALAEMRTYDARVDRLLERTDSQSRQSSELAALRALVEHARGDATVARQWLERSVEIGGEVPVALELLAEMYEAEGATARAESLRRLALDRRSTSR